MIELIRKRRSIRKYLKKSVEPEKIDILKEALLRSPTSRNLKPWEFVIVDDPDLLQRMSECKPHGAAFLRDAPLAVAVCADPEKSDVWVEDCSIASILVQMTALSLDLGSCWIQIRNRRRSDTQTSEDYLRPLLDIPESMRIESVIALGYPDEDKEPISFDSLGQKKIHRNQWLSTKQPSV